MYWNTGLQNVSIYFLPHGFLLTNVATTENYIVFFFLYEINAWPNEKALFIIFYG